MSRIRLLPVLLSLAFLTACATPTPVTVSPVPPAELVQPLPPQPEVPAQANDATIAQYIVDLRAYGRDVAARYDALVAWAKGGK